MRPRCSTRCRSRPSPGGTRQNKKGPDENRALHLVWLACWLGEPDSRPRLRFRRFHLAVARRSRRLERLQQAARGNAHLVHRAIERRLVGLGGLVETAELANELQRRRLDLVLGRRRLEIIERANVSAHSIPPVSDARAPGSAPLGAASRLSLDLVAGVGFEPTTFRL